MGAVISGSTGLVRISHGFRALMRRVGWRERDAQSGALGWYGAFLQNAEVGVLGYPERCSGRVWGVPLGHGSGEVRIGSGDGGVGVGEPLTR